MIGNITDVTTQRRAPTCQEYDILRLVSIFPVLENIQLEEGSSIANGEH